jgi:phage gpG-like protein
MGVLGFDINWRIGGIEEPDGLGKVSVAMERAGDNLSRFGEYVFPKLQPVFEEHTKRQMDAEGQGPVAGHWQALSEAYAAWKDDVAPGNPLLQLKGDLYEGLTSSSSPLAHRAYSAAQFNFGTQNVPYASFHQTGTHRMPARPPFDFNEEQLQQDTQRAGIEGVREAMREAGLESE